MKKYNICIPRKYKDAHGNEKTHFWNVGTMFPMRERDGFSIRLNSPLMQIPRGEMVAFVDLEQAKQERENQQEDDYDDDIPF